MIFCQGRFGKRLISLKAKAGYEKVLGVASGNMLCTSGVIFRESKCWPYFSVIQIASRYVVLAAVTTCFWIQNRMTRDEGRKWKKIGEKRQQEDQNRCHLADGPIVYDLR